MLDSPFDRLFQRQDPWESRSVTGHSRGSRRRTPHRHSGLNHLNYQHFIATSPAFNARKSAFADGFFQSQHYISTALYSVSLAFANMVPWT
jgi:hypothetical protein